MTRGTAILAAMAVSLALGTARGDDDARKAEAEAHFKAGLSFYQQKAWSAALAEFLRSRELFPTRVATLDAAVCLRTEKRYDEAREMFEALLHFADVPAEMRKDAETAIGELSNLVGTVTIVGAEPGAMVLVDGQPRGSVPLGPLRVGAGSHGVRVVKEGFLPIDVRVDVAGKQALSVDARLFRLLRSGRLRVSEQAGRAVDVVVDGAVVGKTPYEGSLDLGDHTIALRGEGALGTQPVTAGVRQNQVTTLTLVAEELNAIARVTPTPAGATVAIDGVVVGHGVWEGRLRGGDHRIEVGADGFTPWSRTVSLAEGKREVVVAALDRDPTSPLWAVKHRSHVVFELVVAGAFAPGFGGNLAAGCASGCSASPALGGHAVARLGYEFGLGLGPSLDVGYLLAFWSFDARPTSLVTNDGVVDHGTANDRLRLGALTLGGALAFHRGDDWSFTARLGAGAAIGTITDHRTGNFTTSAGLAYAVDRTERPSLTRLYLSPELRLGRRLGSHAEIGLGLEVMIVPVLSSPAWANEQRIVASPDLAHQGDGYVKFSEDKLLGSTLVMVNPNIALRYAL